MERKKNSRCESYILGILNENTLRQKVGAFFLSQLDYLKSSAHGLLGQGPWTAGDRRVHMQVFCVLFCFLTQSGTDLVYVLAEGWNSGELTDEVEVGGGDCVNGTAVERRQSLVSRQGQVLDGRRGERSSWIM